MSQFCTIRTKLSVFGLVASCAFSLAAGANDTANRYIKISGYCNKETSVFMAHYAVQVNPGQKGPQEAENLHAPYKMSLKDCLATEKKYPSLENRDEIKKYPLNHFSTAFAMQIDAFIKARIAGSDKVPPLPPPPLADVTEKRVVGRIAEVDCNPDGSGDVQMFKDGAGSDDPVEVIEIKPGNKKLCRTLQIKLQPGTKVRVRADDGFYAAYQFLAPPPKEEPARATASDTDSDTTTKPIDTDGGKDVTKAE